MPKRDTSNPCIKICKFDGTGVCRGCFRTRFEAQAWKVMTDDQKAAVNQRVRPLMGADGARKGGKRLRKLDKKIRKLEAKLLGLKLERAGIAENQRAGGKAASA